MVRILLFGAHGKAMPSNDVGLLKPPANGDTCWIDLQKPDKNILSALGENSGFHPLTIEDCAH